jgi:hypothetical protein
MDLLQVDIEVQGPERMEELARQLSNLDVPNDYVLRVVGDEAGSAKISVYLKPEQRDRIAEAGFASRVVLDLATIKDPREYVSPTNRFAEELEKIRTRGRGD